MECCSGLEAFTVFRSRVHGKGLKLKSSVPKPRRPLRGVLVSENETPTGRRPVRLSTLGSLIRRAPFCEGETILWHSSCGMQR